MDEEFEVDVDADLAGGRLDAVLAKAFPAFSRNRVKDLILAGSVAINGQTAGEPKTKVKLGDTVLITGTLTNCCCESTARDAMQHNYRVLVAADANAALTDAEHAATLHTMAFVFADLYDTDEVLALLG